MQHFDWCRRQVRIFISAGPEIFYPVRVPNLIAIVGRPNVGKSALFNRIVKKRIAIVHDQPGVTRDRVSVEAEWRGRPFTLVDTGGIGLLRGERSNDVIIQAALEQVEMAIEAASVIILVVNVQDGVVPLDREVADRLRRSGKTILVAANKVDSERMEKMADEFVALAFPKIYPVSAIHGEGIERLMDAATAEIPVIASQPEAGAGETPAEGLEADPKSAGKLARTGPLKIAIVGRPNVGKSSIINALTHSSRVIVSPIAGTTRDAVDVPFSVETEGVLSHYILIDTAGMRKARRVDDSVEFFSVQRSEESIIRSDITVLVVDAVEGITEQDKKIADVIVENRRACIVVINKWDLFDEEVRAARRQEIVRREKKVRREGQAKELTTLSQFAEWVQEKLFFLDYAPVIFTSATTGFHLDRLLEAMRYVAAQLQQRIPTAILNRTLRDAVDRRQPVSDAGHRLKFYYATQVRESPPTFLLFVNRDELFSDQYKKYLAGELRAAFGYEGCPIVLAAKPRPKTIAPMRKFKMTNRNTPGPMDAHRAARRERYSRKPKNKSKRSG